MSFPHTGACESSSRWGTKSVIVGNRVLEIIAGVAAVVFITAMVWSDFASDPEPRWRRVRPIQYASALIVLACVIVLGSRG
jgi:hypothetical protein